MNPNEAGNFRIQTPEPTSMDAIYYWACVLIAAVISIAVLGIAACYLYVNFYPVLEQAFWAWATQNF